MRDIDALTYFKGDELAAKVWTDKYALRNKNGEVIEKNPDQMHLRMAKEFARIEAKYGGQLLTEEEIIKLFTDFKYIVPGGSVMAGLGSPTIGSLSNCFVIGQPEDSYSGIMKLREEQAHLMKRRGGVGKDLSTLRPSGAIVNNAAKSSTGAASFMDVDSAITQEVAQRGRRGALMLTLDVRHPDIEEFISKKQDLSKVTGANISVKVTDDFMRAVQDDKDFLLRWPIENTEGLEVIGIPYNTLLKVESSNLYVKKIKARELWEKLIHCAWNTAEPGIMFEDKHIDLSPDGIYPEYRGVSTNPCGEIFMQPYDSCRLIHINLTSLVKDPYTKKASIDDELMRYVVCSAMRLGDDLVDLEIEAINRILKHIEESPGDNKREYMLWELIRETARSSRRCGVGFTGLSDVMAMLGVGFDAKGVKKVHDLMNRIFEFQLEEEINLAKERGPFIGWNPEAELKAADTGQGWYTMVDIDYPEYFAQMIKHGRRNVSFNTVAPTGTVSIMTQTSSGIEPVFALYYTRRKKCNEGEEPDFVDQNGEKFKEFRVYHRPFLQWVQAKLSLESIESAQTMVNVMNDLTLGHLIQDSPWHGNTASEINWKDRLKIQSVVQRYTTHSISSTLNLPKDTTEKEINDIYQLAWKFDLKGVTVYRDGCRAGILVTDTKPKEVFEQHSAPKRPKSLEAELHIVKVKKVKYAVIVGLMEGKPYETFAFELGEGHFLPQKGSIVKVKRGCYNFIGDDDLIIENIHLANDKVEERASSIYISMLLRHGAPIEYVIATAKKVNENIASFTSAICRVLMKYSKKDIEDEVCPDCGSKIVREAGCKKCTNCGYSLCLLMLVK